ncbi:hypothetical protein HK100_006595 [Physocladia obscura]|uniref:Uncharacterized protein n=1 Tax=Physocladia obscura TaxID=109957 RepID=A0AAD5T7N2_9FUNG|nr:hypothetical protein HK100_006595 [Physocladia obscura]
MGPQPKKSNSSAIIKPENLKGRDSKSASSKQGSRLRRQPTDFDWIDSADQADWLCLTHEQISEIGVLELEDSFNKIAIILNYTAWREEIHQSVMMTFFFGVYQTSADSENGSPIRAIEKFKALVTANSAASNFDDLFGPRESKLIVDYALSGIFQHHKLYQYVALNDQNVVINSINVHVEEPIAPAPLIEAITLETYEAEQAKIKQIEVEARLELERVEAEKRTAAANPFDVLEPETIKQVASDTVTMMLKSIADEIDAHLDDQKDRFMQQALRLSNLLPS